MPDVINNPEGDGKGTCNPGITRILSINIALYDFLAFTKFVIHFKQKIRVDKIIGIKNNNTDSRSWRRRKPFRQNGVFFIGVNLRVKQLLGETLPEVKVEYGAHLKRRYLDVIQMPQQEQP